MNVLITGGAGFLGHRLAARLLQGGTLAGPDGRPRRIERLTLLDQVEPGALADARVETVVGDIADPRLMDRAIDSGTDAVFHLAAVVSGTAEADFDLGMRVNLDATRALLERCRALGRAPRVVFTSSVAVYGGDLPETVQDSTILNPQTSYGTEKAVGELLVNDYSRRGFIDGRILRLPTVSVRPGRPNTAASSFASGIIREPLNGVEAVCPVDASARLWLISPATVVECLVVGHDLPAAAFGRTRAVNLPGFSITVAEMVSALERVAGAAVARRIRWAPDPTIARMVATWPGRIDNARALALGFPADADFESVIRRYIAEAGIEVTNSTSETTPREQRR